jgi:dephospho-CoA kinase
MQGSKSTAKVALTGKIRSGKSTAGNYLATFYDFTPFAFADALKRSFHTAFPHVPGLPKPRAYYQKFGQWAREAMGETIWIDLTFKSVNSINPERVLIEDVRNINEIEALRAEGYTIIRITAPEQLRIKRALDAGDDFTVHDLVHETELNVDTFDVDYDVWNGSGPLVLEWQLDAIMTELGVDIRA